MTKKKTTEAEHAKDPESATLDECVDQYRRLLEVGNHSVQTQGNESCKLEEKPNTGKTRIRNINSGRAGTALGLFRM